MTRLITLFYCKSHYVRTILFLRALSNNGSPQANTQRVLFVGLCSIPSGSNRRRGLVRNRDSYYRVAKRESEDEVRNSIRHWWDM